MHQRRPTRAVTRRHALAGLLAGGFGLAGGCGWDGHFKLLGYTTRPNYDESIKTVYVPTFRNKMFQTEPYRRMEVHLTRAVVREIETKTPFKVVSDCEKADTELLGTVLFVNKQILNRNQQNEVREMELVLGVEVVWRDLRDGRILTNRRRQAPPVDPTLPPFDPNLPPPAEGPDIPIPVLLQATGRGLPEAGESNATALDMAMNRAAVQVVNLMEKPWDLAECP
jgi:hypothetical protein